jgi:hypothetical protein
MPFPDLKRLRLQLLEGGLAPHFVERAILELQDHYEDIEADALNSGLSASAASALARSSLGSEAVIVAAALSHSELLTWVHRWPRCARSLRAAALCLILPAVPIVYCAQRGASIARWSASVSLAMVATGALLLSMQMILGGLG